MRILIYLLSISRLATCGLLPYHGVTIGITPNSGPVHSQYHAQDKYGQYVYGYASDVSAKDESKSADGVTTGGYSYIDANGVLQTVRYIADPIHGFRVSASNIPRDLPEVALAKAQHFEAYEKIKAEHAYIAAAQARAAAVAISPVPVTAGAVVPVSVGQAAPLAYVSHAVAPVPLESQYHAQDKYGQYAYGYTGPLSSKTETKTADGITRGGYSYVDANGVLQSVQYISDPIHGFRVKATNLPEAPVVTLIGPKVSSVVTQKDDGALHPPAGINPAPLPQPVPGITPVLPQAPFLAPENVNTQLQNVPVDFNPYQPGKNEFVNSVVLTESHQVSHPILTNPTNLNPDHPITQGNEPIFTNPSILTNPIHRIPFPSNGQILTNLSPSVQIDRVPFQPAQDSVQLILKQAAISGPNPSADPNTGFVFPQPNPVPAPNAAPFIISQQNLEAASNVQADQAAVDSVASGPQNPPQQNIIFVPNYQIPENFKQEGAPINQGDINAAAPNDQNALPPQPTGFLLPQYQFVDFNPQAAPNADQNNAPVDQSEANAAPSNAAPSQNSNFLPNFQFVSFNQQGAPVPEPNGTPVPNGASVDQAAINAVPNDANGAPAPNFLIPNYQFVNINPQGGSNPAPNNAPVDQATINAANDANGVPPSNFVLPNYQFVNSNPQGESNSAQNIVPNDQATVNTNGAPPPNFLLPNFQFVNVNPQGEPNPTQNNAPVDQPANGAPQSIQNLIAASNPNVLAPNYQLLNLNPDGAPNSPPNGPFEQDVNFAAQNPNAIQGFPNVIPQNLPNAINLPSPTQNPNFPNFQINGPDGPVYQEAFPKNLFFQPDQESNLAPAAGSSSPADDGTQAQGGAEQAVEQQALFLKTGPTGEPPAPARQESAPGEPQIKGPTGYYTINTQY